MKYYIYKLVCNDVDVKYAYAGSTKHWIKRRSKHKCDSNNEKYGNKKVYRIINEHGGWDNWFMILQEICFCESKAEAVEIERRYYDELNTNAMNTNRPMCTPEELKEDKAENSKQYQINNKIAIKEHSKQYNIDNKDAIKEKKKQYQNNNKISIKDYQKQYKNANKETISTRKTEKIHCEACNCYNSRGHITRHNKTTKHQNNIKK